MKFYCVGGGDIERKFWWNEEPNSYIMVQCCHKFYMMPTPTELVGSYHSSMLNVIKGLDRNIQEATFVNRKKAWLKKRKSRI